MIYQELAPPAALAPYVKFFWTLKGTSKPLDYLPHRLFADALPTLVVHHKNQFLLREQDDLKLLPKSSVHGHNAQVWDMLVKSDFEIFGIYFYPLSIPEIFGIPASLLYNQDYSLEELLGAAGRELEERLMNAEDVQHRIACISSFIYRKLKYQKTKISLPFAACLDRIIKSGGEITIEQIAQQSSFSIRSLERQFSSELGVSPKLYSRIVRFQRAIKLFENNLVKDFTDLSYYTGYYDQSHFIREFKHFSGMRPKDYFLDSPHTADGFAQIA